MTKEEFDAKYGDSKVYFKWYYKYSFGFEGVGPEGESIAAIQGGDRDDIYRYEVHAGIPKQIVSADDWSSVKAYKDGQLIFEHTN